MARIRTIKPEFWTSEQIMECSPTARLLFIGLWNFCDDGGNHPASAKTIKAEVFPGDDIGIDAVSALVGELAAQGLMIEYEAAGKRYWHVTGWHHQKIDKPTAKYPEPPENLLSLTERSPSNRRAIAERSPPERKGEEGKGYIPTSDEVGCDQAALGHSLPDCPHRQIIELYAKHLPALPQPRIWDGQRAENLRARWRWALTAKKSNGHRYAHDLQSALSFFDRFFGYVAASDFLTGRDGKWSGCDLAWLVKAENFAKTLEGKYENRTEVVT